jgi:hypothetical protein
MKEMLKRLKGRGARLLGADKPRVRQIVDLRNEGNDPLNAYYMALLWSPLLEKSPLVNARLGDCRMFESFGLPVDAAEDNPLTAAALLCARKGPATEAEIIALLRRYYDNVRPANALEAMGLSASDAPGLRSAGPMADSFPWETSDPRLRETYVGSFLDKDAREFGQALVPQGHTYFGPVSDDKIRMEASRIISLCRSIGEHGFIAPGSADNDIWAIALRNEVGEYRWILQGGQHRASVAFALGLHEMPVAVRYVVRREDAAHWRNVRTGMFSQNGALTLFDRIFRGTATACVAGWNRQHVTPAGGTEPIASKNSIPSGARA